MIKKVILIIALFVAGTIFVTQACGDEMHGMHEDSKAERARPVSMLIQRARARTQGVFQRVARTTQNFRARVASNRAQFKQRVESFRARPEVACVQSNQCVVETIIIKKVQKDTLCTCACCGQNVVVRETFYLTE